MAALTACTGARPRLARQSPPSPSTESAPILLPTPASPDDPVGWWLREWLEPRLALFSSQLTLSCSAAETSVLLVNLSALKVRCEDLTRANPTEPLSCSRDREGLLRVALPAHKRCNLAEDGPRWMESLHLPRELGLYLEKNGLFEANPLYPNSSGPSFRLSKEASVLVPGLASWLGSASAPPAAGLISWELRLAKNNSAAFSSPSWLADLRALFIREKRPQLLPLFAPEIFNLVPAKNVGNSPARPPFFALTKNTQSPLLSEACTYLDRWLRARQILSGADVNDSRRVEFDCAFRWSSGDARMAGEPSLLLARLPLPLQSGGTEKAPQFLIRSLEEARNPALLRYLKP